MLQQFVQCLFVSFSDEVSSGNGIDPGYILSRCSLEQHDDAFTISDPDFFSAVTRFSEIAIASSGRVGRSVFQSRIIRNRLSQDAVTEPAFPEGLTDELGVTRIKVQFVAGKSGYYAVIFSSGNVLTLYNRFIKFENYVTNITVADSRMLKRYDVTLNDKTAVYFTNFQQQTTFKALVSTRDSLNNAVPLKLSL
jgi:hypothetical protein